MTAINSCNNVSFSLFNSEFLLVKPDNMWLNVHDNSVKLMSPQAGRFKSRKWFLSTRTGVNKVIGIEMSYTPKCSCLRMI